MSTLDFYNKNADVYFSQTKEGDLSENYTRFLCNLKEHAYILDFGCGSGRDSKYFIEHGYRVEAIDGSTELCKLASKYIGQKVKCMMFEDLSDIDTYDGIWACSSILHVEKDKLSDVLIRMYKALKKNGIMYISFKKGTGYEVKDGKYFNYMMREDIDNILSNCNFKYEFIDYYETLPSIKKSENETVIWVNYIIKKI